MTKRKTPETPETPEIPEVSPPELYFEFPEDSGFERVKMTYGLEMDIRRMLPDPQAAMSLLLGDPLTQDYMVRRCLTRVNKMITDWDDLISEDEIEKLDFETREKLLMWAGDHSLYFFAKRTMGIANLNVRLEGTLRNLLPPHILNGLKDSDSKTPSVGDSDVLSPTSTESTGD